MADEELNACRALKFLWTKSTSAGRNTQILSTLLTIYRKGGETVGAVIRAVLDGDGHERPFHYDCRVCAHDCSVGDGRARQNSGGRFRAPAEPAR
jgi:hypothetical protein